MEDFLRTSSLFKSVCRARDVRIGIRGSATTGRGSLPGGEPKDFDFFAASDELFQRAIAAGAKGANGALRVGDTMRYFPAIHQVELQLKRKNLVRRQPFVFFATMATKLSQRCPMSSIEHYGYVLIKSEASLDQLGHAIGAALNVAASNPNPASREQKRYSRNKGGRYYLFEVCGIEFNLICNNGEASLGREKEWQYYVWIDSTLEAFDEQFLVAASAVLVHALRKAGIEVAEAPNVPE